MSKLSILGATALSLTLAVAAPAFAADRGEGGGMHGGGMHGGGAMHFGGGMGSGMQVGRGAPAFRGAQASMSPSTGPSQARAVNGANFNGGNFAGRGGAQFAQGGYRGSFRGGPDHDHGHFGRGLGFAAGSALGYGYGGYYGNPYYYDDYAYNDYYDDGYPGYVGDTGVVVSAVADPSYCAQRYKSYDPASGTYLGYDGLRHPCGQ